LVLKSPTHSCRIRHLLELFPEARFVHIVRDPYVVFPSTVNLWKSLYETHGLQKPTFAGLDEYVFTTFTHLYAKLEEGKRLIPPGQFHELRYEDLVRDPVGEMRRLYERLGLGGFEAVRPRLEAYAAAHRDYKTNCYALTPERREEISRRWGDVIRRYGYVTEAVAAAGPPAVTAAAVPQPPG
ncbi:MAG TPA: sulfotransferase, partial [Gemmataceae bacterium]|nr:sulfotransferase [Gemmataceae bacterium]